MLQRGGIDSAVLQGNAESGRLRVQVEYVFVDDGSTDSTLDILKKLRAQDKQVHYVSFSRNFGKESALYAGLRAANGDFVATLDAALQDPPSLLPQMIEFLDGHADYDCVATRRETRRGEPIVRSFFARMFYRIINRMSETEIVCMTRRFVDAVLSLKEVNRFSKGIFS